MALIKNIISSLTLSHNCILEEGGSDGNLGWVWHLIQVDYQTKKLYIYYNLSLKVFKTKDELCIGLTQENSIKFLVQSIYLMYTGLIVL